VSRIEGNGKSSLRGPKLSTRKFCAWKKKKKKKKKKETNGLTHVMTNVKLRAD
jgi:hypothetical protein